jgi:phosphoribosyl 1,2-cyclic phosphodiesterase
MNQPLPLRVVVLGSGSSGNSTAITDGVTTVLVDCGFSARETSRRLSESGLDPTTVSAILVTHEHGDHVRGIDVFVRRHSLECRVLASEGTFHCAGVSSEISEPIQPGETLRVGTLDVVAFNTSHDASEPVGFRVSNGFDAVGIATDTGVIGEEALEVLRGVRVLGLECNHDLRMLETGPYPFHLKRRISSAQGHLSNADAADALERLASDSLEHVIALHRSRTNNTAQLAGTALQDRVAQLDIAVRVTVSSQATPCEAHNRSCASHG